MANEKNWEPTLPQLDTALDVLLWLSENSTDGRLRDDISAVRQELYDVRG